MTILLTCVAVVYVMWLLALIAMGDADRLLSFTVAFTLFPVFLALMVVITPIVILCSKTAREEAKKKFGE